MLGWKLFLFDFDFFRFRVLIFLVHFLYRGGKEETREVSEYPTASDVW